MRAAHILIVFYLAKALTCQVAYLLPNQSLKVIQTKWQIRFLMPSLTIY